MGTRFHDTSRYALLAAAIGVTGCTARIADFTVVSSRNTLITEGRPTGPRTKGQDCVPVILIPIGQVSLKSAIDDAIDKAGPQFDTLRDAVVTFANRSFLFGELCYEVEATPISSRSAGTAAPVPPAPGTAVR